MNEYFARTPVCLAYDLEFNHIPNINMYETDKDFVSVDTNVSDTSQKPEKKLSLLSTERLRLLR